MTLASSAGGHGDRARPQAAFAAVPPRDHGRESDQHDAGHGREHAGQVAAAEPVGVDVAHVHGAVDEREHAERERERGLQPGRSRAERDDRADPGGERDQPGEGVLAEAEAGPPVHERVVERVHEGQQGRDDEDPGHRASSRSRKPITRCSYSAGRAASPPTWRASGISHSVAASPAARA